MRKTRRSLHAADCLSVDVADAGNFSSPGFPVSLPAQPVFCEWKMESGANRRVRLDFHVVDLPAASADGQHPASYVSFGEFNSLGLRVEYRRVLGGGRQTALRPFTSTTHGAWLTMLSTGDPARLHRGLLVEVRHLQYGQLFIV